MVGLPLQDGRALPAGCSRKPSTQGGSRAPKPTCNLSWPWQSEPAGQTPQLGPRRRLRLSSKPGESGCWPGTATGCLPASRPLPAAGGSFPPASPLHLLSLLSLQFEYTALQDESIGDSCKRASVKAATMQASQHGSQDCQPDGASTAPTGCMQTDDWIMLSNYDT